MRIQKEIGKGLILRNSSPDDAEGLAQLQEIVFPSLKPEERFQAKHYVKHIDLFPEGQLLVLDGTQVVGMTTTIRYDFDLAHAEHRFEEMIAGGYCTTHQPKGQWLYGLDIGSHPAYRGKGIGKAIYQARDEVVMALGLKGQVTVGMLSGYGALKEKMSADDYYKQLLNAERWDPTVSIQIKAGFEPKGLIPDYVNDPICDNYGVLLIKENKNKG